MIFGLFDFLMPPGKMELTLEKLNFAKGEKVKGHAKLTTQRPIKARGVFVRIYAVEETRGGKSSSTRTVFEFQQPLEQGEKEYSGGDYDFELVIPGGSSGPQLPQEAQMAVAALNMIANTGFRTSFVKWYVEAKLDIQGGRDVAKQVQINVA